MVRKSAGMISKMTDIHHHVLWGLDDGPADAESMHRMLHAAHRQGITRIYATPHASPGLAPFDRALYDERLQEAQEYCRKNELDIELLSGAEVAWTYQTVEALRRGALPTLGGSEYALIELWEDVSWSEVRSAAEQLLRAGVVPVFAHVERYRCFRWLPGKAIALRQELGIGYQVNATTLLYPRKLSTRYFIMRMLRAKAIDAVASDAHGFPGRPLRMRRAYKALKERCGAEYAKKLFEFDGVSE